VFEIELSVLQLSVEALLHKDRIISQGKTVASGKTRVAKIKERAVQAFETTGDCHETVEQNSERELYKSF
jgi:hypothetical protein